MPADEVHLSGGNASGSVVKVGGTVRKPWSEATPSTAAFVEALRARGIDAPRPLGRDEYGRQIVEYIPGVLADAGGPLAEEQLARVGGLVRAIHDAAADLPMTGGWDEPLVQAPAAELICHNDLAPWNLVTGERWVFIDWDAAGPSTRLWDLAYAAQAFTLNDPAADPRMAAARLAAFVEGYGCDESFRLALPDVMGDRAAAMHEALQRAHRLGHEPWATMYISGHGAHWEAAAAYVRRHRSLWTDALAPFAG